MRVVRESAGFGGAGVLAAAIVYFSGAVETSSIGFFEWRERTLNL